MKNIALTSLALGLLSIAPSAFAQTQGAPCPPNSWMCVDVQVGGSVGGHVQGSIGGGAVVQQPVVVQPPVVVQQPVVVQPPVYIPPRRVYVQPPPVVYYQPAPVYVQQPVVYGFGFGGAQGVSPQRRVYVGLQAQLAGALLPSDRNGGFMGGAGASLRMRGNGVLGLELGFNVVGGTDYNGDSRTEVPITTSMLFYFNPQNRFQVYGLVGLGFSFADVRYAAANRVAHRGASEGEYAYFGGLAGLGAELQLSPRFSLFADVRGFVRGRIDRERERNPEFTRTLANGATQSANGSAGFVSQFGAVLYF